MKLHLNGEAVATDATTLAEFLLQNGYGEATVATAVNGDFVPAGLRETHSLNDGDHVEVLAPMQGG